MASYSSSVQSVIKLQALYRGHLARKQYRNMRRMSGTKTNTSPAAETGTREKSAQNYRSRSQTEAGLEQKTVEYKDGSIYVGQILDGKRHGFGQQDWPDGAQYIGHWDNDMTNGRGRFRYSDGDVYDGEWVDDKANGYGEYARANGSRYVGQWKDDQQDGEGTETWPDGTTFVGAYVAGIKNGKGTYSWGDGTQYEGDWKDNRIDGFVIRSTNRAGREDTHGRTGECTRECGRTTACTAREHTCGQTAGCTWGSIRETRRRDTECTSGRTGDGTRAAGTTADRRARAPTFLPTGWRGRECGRQESASSGSMKFPLLRKRLRMLLTKRSQS